MKKDTSNPHNRNSSGRPSLSRRNFLLLGSFSPLVGGPSEAFALRDEAAYAAAHASRSQEEQVNVALVGFGPWGREIATTLSRLPEANLMAICDNYDVMLRRAQRSVPDASRHTDYREVLDNPDVQAVIIATPTHQHKQIVIDALDAGKNVYCEAPIASTIEDARAIALAAQHAEGQIFQCGLLYRSEPQYRSVFGFIRSGALGRPSMARLQWHTKQSWRRASPNREREIAQNWRLDEQLSTGLIGEVGMQQMEAAAWFLNERPSAVTGFGNVVFWDDGRTVPDTIQAIFETPSGVTMSYNASLVSSFDAAYELYYGSNSTIMLRDSKAWMFKEVDAPLLGWEVYARKDRFYKEQGIALVANATKLDAQADDPAADDPNTESPLWYALKEFMDNHFFGPYPPSSDYMRGYESAVIGIKANEAIMSKTRIELDDAWFELS